MKKLMLLSLSLVLLGAGCFGAEEVEETLDVEEVEFNEVSELGNEQDDLPVDEEGMKTFTHSASGISFKFPADNTVFWNVDFDTETLLPATADSNGAAIVESIDEFFEGDVAAVGVTYPEGYTIEEWIENGLLFWMPLDLIVKQSEIEFEGREAVEVIGPGDESGLYKVVIIPDGENLIVIRQDRDTEFLNEVFDSMSFAQ